MITLSARITSAVANENPFILGSSALGSSDSLGENISLDIEINKRNILSLENGIEERSDNTQPSWGIISNRGSLSFKDTDGKLKDYAERRILKKGAKCVIKLNNTLSKTSSVVGTYYVEDWNYDKENREVSVSLTDGLERWQDVEYSGFPPIKSNDGGEQVRAWDIVNNGFTEKQLEDIVIADPLIKISKDVGINVLTSVSARNTLQNTLINFAQMEKSSLWTAFDKICNICGLYIYNDKNANAVIRAEFGD